MTTPTPSPDASGLTPVQAMLADLAGDIIGRRAADSTARQFVGALLQHSWRISVPWADESFLRAQSERDIEDTLRKLARSWPSNADVEAPAASKETATALVRSTMRARLVSALNEFVNRATPEEGWMLLDMLAAWMSQASHHDAITSGFAEEMSHALDRAEGQYIRVHPRHEKAVEEFVAQLHRADDEAERRACQHRPVAA